ncbi:MAG: hypothetical protein D3M94_01545 [Rhodocyclales bacterium GT-UBC]|nr:MAG: hypothetical protein D3M94_01545 [Rhodocyclales bacterium GT-UBC]
MPLSITYDRSASIPSRRPGQAMSAVLPVRWYGLAWLALGLSTLFAVVLVVARTPFLGLGAAFFRTALVLHVDLAVVVWFLAVAAGIWLIAIPVKHGGLARLANGGFWLAGSGVFGMLVSPFDGSAQPVLANYVPVLDTPIFYLGLTAFLGGIALAALAGLFSFFSRSVAPSRRFEPLAFWQWAVLAAIVAFLGACLVFGLALRSAAGDVSLDGRLWGGGHVLQIVHTLMLMAAWLCLGQAALSSIGLRGKWVAAMLAGEVLAVLADMAIAMLFQVDTPSYRRGFTEIMRWATWPAPVALGGCLLIGFQRLARVRRLTPVEFGLIGTVLLFLLGCVVGAGIRGETTVVPAHYHGTVGAVTLAYMLWARHALDRAGLPFGGGWLWRWQPFIYGCGIGLMVLGLAWAGSMGVMRKSPHAEVAVAEGMRQGAMGLAGIGGLFATLGAGIFVACIAISIFKKRTV